ncbi:zinc ribbon domain-containing protein [Desulfobaculum senezii]|jgi:putative FmdB family regulatory protein|uniref:FmdB family zinc ribbon protein n=1 Tax=Desulfobaculum sp. SPO524 TaxID=3378071 RepID=UPI0038543938
MPIYEYRCNDCKQVFEEWQRNFDDKEVPCPVCGGASQRLISNTSFVLKGSGWYVTDYCQGGSHGSAKSDVAGGKDSSSTEPAKKDSAPSKAEQSSPQA